MQKLGIKSIVCVYGVCVACVSGAMSFPANAQLKIGGYIETAATMNVAEHVRDISFGPQVAFATMDAAKEMGISVEAAAALAGARHSEVLSYLNQKGKPDELCANAMAGRIK